MNFNNIKTIFLTSLVATFGMYVVYLLANSFIPGAIWNGLALSQSAVNVEYCEYNNPDSFFHQKINTYSNLAYFFFGVLVLTISKFDKDNQIASGEISLKNFPELGFLLGACFVYLCFGSSFFHGSLTLIGQRVDMNGTYGLTFLLVAIVLFHLFATKGLSKKTKNYLIVGLIALIFGFYALAPLVSSKILIPILILTQFAGMIIVFAKQPKKRFLSIALLSFACVLWAIKIRTDDVQKLNCDPKGLLQGHAIWHVLTAFSSFLCFAFFRFEKR
ncbi:ceramidase domain-containing protein [Lacihabitans lacunae]|uniref:Ceramidase domain-containing protein n=1 Tax=Lacihabitans lacunae TaxID=1028214 RepID=A0ABV7YTP5_9BACT